MELILGWHTRTEILPTILCIILLRRKDVISKSCKDQALADLSSLDQKMRVRLEWSDVDLMRSIILFLDTQS